MSVDLEQSLAQLARSVGDDLVAERMTGQVHQMVTRIRRRRAARHTSTGVLGVGAVVAIGIAGTQWGEGNDAEVASPGPSPHLLDTADDACGRSLAELGWVATGPVVLEPYGEPPTGRDDGGVSLATHVVKTEAVDLSFDSLAVRVVAVDPETGLVAGVPPVSPGFPEPDWEAAVAQLGLDEDEAQSFMSSASWPLRDCDAEPEAFGPETNLATGTYDVYGMQVLHPEEAFDGLDTFVAVGGPWPITVLRDDEGAPADASDGELDEAQVALDEAQVATARQREEARAGLEALLAAEPSGAFPACGAPVDLGDGALLTLDLTLPEQRTVGGERLSSEITVRTTEGRHVIANAAGAGARLVLARDGVVVGLQAYRDSDEVTLLDLDAAATAVVPLTGGLNLCTNPMTVATQLPLPAGTYQAYAVLDVMVKEVTGRDGAALSVTDQAFAVSEAVDVTID